MQRKTGHVKGCLYDFYENVPQKELGAFSILWSRLVYLAGGFPMPLETHCTTFKVDRLKKSQKRWLNHDKVKFILTKANTTSQE